MASIPQQTFPSLYAPQQSWMICEGRMWDNKNPKAGCTELTLMPWNYYMQQLQLWCLTLGQCPESRETKDVPAEAVPRTTGWVRATLRSQIPSLWPTYSLSSWHKARDPVVALKLDTIWAGRREERAWGPTRTHSCFKISGRLKMTAY